MTVKVNAYFTRYAAAIETPLGLFVRNTSSSAGGTTYDNYEIRPLGTVVKTGWGDASGTYTVGDHMATVEMEESDYAAIVKDAGDCAADWRNCSGDNISMTTWCYMKHVPYWGGANLDDALEQNCSAERALGVFRQQTGR